MCAIFGEIDYNTRAGSGIYTHEITSSMRHRGPDQDGAVFCGHAALLHTRLCVIDVENGRQPMSFRANGQEYTIVYNGELYTSGCERA